MNWRKQYKAARQWRTDRLVRQEKLDKVIKTAFESGRNSVAQLANTMHATGQQAALTDGLLRQSLFLQQQAAQRQLISPLTALLSGGLAGRTIRNNGICK